MKLTDQIDFIEEAIDKMRTSARAARTALSEAQDVDITRALLITMFGQLESLKIWCETLRDSKEFKELGT